MSGMKNKVYRLSQENKVYCEDLIKVDDSVFENVYKQVDDILYKIIQYNNKLNENSKYINRAEEKYDENVLNTIPFLAGRGRGKTSALLSVLNNLNNMSSYSWSKLYKSNVKFKVLPYIDAAMLAKKEFIFDVILTEMWDSFDKDIQEDKYVDRYNKYNSEYAIKEIRESFIKVRKAYSNLTQKENEKYTSSEELLPTASVLHELSVSVNLRDEMQELVKQYLTYFSMRDEYHNTYLVIAIDDVDMSGDRAYYILEQLRRFFRINNVIIFMTDVRQGLVDDDHKVVQMLRKSKKPVILVVNKVDSFEKYMNDVYEFYNLGLGDPVPISGASRLGIGDMLDEVVSHFDEDSKNEEEDDRPRIAIIGKPNVGKSSIINKLLGENRVIVSDIAGTTRDAIDTEIVRNGTEYVFIDTAGLRRKSKIKEDIERYSIIRTVSAVERCNVAVLVIDATEGVTDQDAKIAGIAHERGKGMIIVVNKWDAVEKDDKTIYKFTKEIREKLSYMPYAELLFVSAATGQRLPKLFETIDAVIENHSLRVATGVLNEIMTEAVAMQQPPTDKGKRLKLFYITQVAVKPPTFVIFVNDKELMHFSYTRYIENKIREAFGFRGTPLKFIIRERKEK